MKGQTGRETFKWNAKWPKGICNQIKRKTYTPISHIPKQGKWSLTHNMQPKPMTSVRKSQWKQDMKYRKYREGRRERTKSRRTKTKEKTPAPNWIISPRGKQIIYVAQFPQAKQMTIMSQRKLGIKIDTWRKEGERRAENLPTAGTPETADRRICLPPSLPNSCRNYFVNTRNGN